MVLWWNALPSMTSKSQPSPLAFCWVHYTTTIFRLVVDATRVYLNQRHPSLILKTARLTNWENFSIYRVGSRKTQYSQNCISTPLRISNTTRNPRFATSFDWYQFDCIDGSAAPAAHTFTATQKGRAFWTNCSKKLYVLWNAWLVQKLQSRRRYSDRDGQTSRTERGEVRIHAPAAKLDWHYLQYYQMLNSPTT